MAGCHAVDALRWFAAPGEFEAAEPIEAFAYAGGKRRGITRQFNPVTNDWYEGLPLEYDGLEIALVRFASGVLGKVSVNFECIQPYAFPLSIFGDRGTIKSNRLFCPGQSADDQWTEIQGTCPNSSDVSHHPPNHWRRRVELIQHGQRFNVERDGGHVHS